MFAILVPVFSVSLVAVMLYGTLKARRRGYMKGIPSSWSLLRSRRSWVHLFWTMDIIGLVFLCGALGCILLPLALGGGVAKGRTPQTLVPLVIGILCLPAFVIWERYGAPQPIFPSWAMKDRTVVVVLLIQFFLAIGGSTREAYLYYALVVSFNQCV
jgi:SIT family siderophore-iron:H+ symporter-like MFS transporter